MNLRLRDRLPRQGLAGWLAWAVIGTTLAVVLILGGLLAVGAILLAYVAMLSHGLNK